MHRRHSSRWTHKRGSEGVCRPARGADWKLAREALTVVELRVKVVVLFVFKASDEGYFLVLACISFLECCPCQFLLFFVWIVCFSHRSPPLSSGLEAWGCPYYLKPQQNKKCPSGTKANLSYSLLCWKQTCITPGPIAPNIHALPFSPLNPKTQRALSLIGQCLLLGKCRVGWLVRWFGVMNNVI